MFHLLHGSSPQVWLTIFGVVKLDKIKNLYTSFGFYNVGQNFKYQLKFCQLKLITLNLSTTNSNAEKCDTLNSVQIFIYQCLVIVQ